ncbi:Uncharacterised protein [Mycobacteroides abscessus subsp. abscessus]|nr:Uncharacterised protein [Mycobacteroides abscessus subsp. abscessus]
MKIREAVFSKIVDLCHQPVFCRGAAKNIDFIILKECKIFFRLEFS